MASGGVLSKHTVAWLVDKGLCSPPTAEVLGAQGITHLTGIQLRAFPALLAKTHTFLHARTGSGKTLAFLLPTLERLRAMGFKESHGVGALVVSPTRELAVQISRVLAPLARAHGFTHAALIGGKKVTEEHTHNGCTVLVATPGRLCDVLSRPDCPFKLTKLKVLVLDEADKLMDGGTNTQYLRSIHARLPRDNVQHVLVSATVNQQSSELAREILKVDLTYITAEKENTSTNAQIKQSYLMVGAGERAAMLITVLRTLRKKKSIVFFNSCDSVKFHHELLTRFDLPVMYCVGQEKQGRRSQTYSAFLSAPRGILLTTAMAERGWDVPGVKWIIQYDPPHQPEDYIHRIGRTGRGEGGAGQALLFLRPQEHRYVQVLRNMKMDLELLEFQGELKEVKDEVITAVSNDKELSQVGKRAYKKFVRAYQCHGLKEVFSVSSLCLAEVCHAFGFTKPPLDLGHLT